MGSPGASFFAEAGSRFRAGDGGEVRGYLLRHLAAHLAEEGRTEELVRLGRDRDFLAAQEALQPSLPLETLEKARCAATDLGRIEETAELLLVRGQRMRALDPARPHATAGRLGWSAAVGLGWCLLGPRFQLIWGMALLEAGLRQRGSEDGGVRRLGARLRRLPPMQPGPLIQALILAALHPRRMLPQPELWADRLAAWLPPGRVAQLAVDWLEAGREEIARILVDHLGSWQTAASVRVDLARRLSAKGCRVPSLIARLRELAGGIGDVTRPADRAEAHLGLASLETGAAALHHIEEAERLTRMAGDPLGFGGERRLVLEAWLEVSGDAGFDRAARLLETLSSRREIALSLASMTRAAHRRGGATGDWMRRLREAVRAVSTSEGRAPVFLRVAQVLEEVGGDLPAFLREIEAEARAVVDPGERYHACSQVAEFLAQWGRGDSRARARKLAGSLQCVTPVASAAPGIWAEATFRGNPHFSPDWAEILIRGAWAVPVGSSNTWELAAVVRVNRRRPGPARMKRIAAVLRKGGFSDDGVPAQAALAWAEEGGLAGALLEEIDRLVCPRRLGFGPEDVRGILEHLREWPVLGAEAARPRRWANPGAIHGVGQPRCHPLTSRAAAVARSGGPGGVETAMSVAAGIQHPAERAMALATVARIVAARGGDVGPILEAALGGLAGSPEEDPFGWVRIELARVAAEVGGEANWRRAETIALGFRDPGGRFRAIEEVVSLMGSRGGDVTAMLAAAAAIAPMDGMPRHRLAAWCRLARMTAAAGRDAGSCLREAEREARDHAARLGWSSHCVPLLEALVLAGDEGHRELAREIAELFRGTMGRGAYQVALAERLSKATTPADRQAAVAVAAGIEHETSRSEAWEVLARSALAAGETALLLRCVDGMTDGTEWRLPNLVWEIHAAEHGPALKELLPLCASDPRCAVAAAAAMARLHPAAAPRIASLIGELESGGPGGNGATRRMGWWSRLWGWLPR